MTYASKIILYIVQPNETLLDIANKFHIDGRELTRLNPVLKYSSPHEGQPLNIIVPDIDIPTRETSDNSLNCQLIFIKHASLIKELIIAKIFVSDYLLTTTQSLQESNDKIILCIEKKHQTANIYNYKILIEEMQNELINFVEIITQKDQEALANFNKHFNDLVANFSQLGIISLNASKENSKDTIKNLMKQWELFILRLIAYKFDEAEQIYRQIESKYLEIEQTL